MSRDREVRWTSSVVEVRAGSDGRRRIAGYAAKFNKFSRDLGGFVERVSPSAFNRSRGDGWPNVLARYQHDDLMLLGTTGAGTLTLTIDATGLFYEVDPPDTRADVVELVRRGDVRFSSFAFWTPSGGDEWGLSEMGYPQRTLLGVGLADVSPVNVPAYSDTSVALRSLAQRAHLDVGEVESLAERRELKKLFVRTDRRSDQPARLTTGGRVPMDGVVALDALASRRYDPTEVAR